MLPYFLCFFLPYVSSLIVPTGWESNDAEGGNKLILPFQNTVPKPAFTSIKVDIVTVIDFLINQNYIVLIFYCEIFHGKLRATIKPSHLYLIKMSSCLHQMSDAVALFTAKPTDDILVTLRIWVPLS